MVGEKFTLMQYSVYSILGMIEAKQFVIPEIQRPFVWKRSQVRDLIDSLYNGYPTGYIITWKNPDVKTKDGTVANGNQILIDGQQRITALMAAIAGIEVLDDDFNKDRVKIAFNPLTEDADKRFAVQDASHLKDKKWVPDIAEIFKNDFDPFEFVENYCNDNPGIKRNDVNNEINKLKGIANRQIGVIMLDQNLDIDEVTEIFIRINSKGTPLSQSDFVMSKMAADTVHGGNTLRKVVDYFCHLAVKPDFYPQMIKDAEFEKTDYASKIKWLAKDNEDIYDPDYNDMLRVSFMYSFNRARLSELVSLLAGRDFETHEFKEEIVEDSYHRLEDGIKEFIREYNFEQFVLAIKGAGFKSSKLLGSQMTLDFAYMIYLKLSKDSKIPNDQIKHFVQKWFVMSTLTGRYVGSPESVMSRDIRMINEKGFASYFAELEASLLSDTFWNVTLPQNLATISTNSPAFNTFLAAQINLNCNSMLMRGTMISDLLNISGDVHHIFPKAYLKKNGVDTKIGYNQVANFTMLDTQVNKAIGDDAPCVYFGKVIEACKQGTIAFGNISDRDVLEDNLKENAIPSGVINMDVNDYDQFLEERRILMAKLVEKYYKSL
ncbi:GmrSD restriction endonuclease domain-containing protein [Butyrivibrio sp. INlla14]|uniref:GmrSD restriction endonuclease domain-containing protein n=1 Tax=Butyrivibrio sp. INlla14 TaxID=1520808 RepID=UPI000876F691|nr:DUF262 domain-containing protein [Butyrivibrio sp. INlla14]SCY63051.1 Protein of unknown function DUF262 [Butyrivibrio sp. INlla14]